MSSWDDEGRLVAAGVGTFAAAYLAIGPPLWFALLLGAALLATLRPTLVIVALCLLISVRAHGALDALGTAPSRPVAEEWVELARDPRPGEFGWWAEAELAEQRVLVEAGHTDLGAYAHGDRLLVSGVLVGSAPETDWELSRRLVGSLRISDVHAHLGRSGPIGWATAARTLLADGARSLDADHHALFTGLVYGDDRHQDPLTADDFRAAGLGHLLAVSGQNVLFVLVVAAPLLARVGSFPWRVAGTITVLVAFGLLTRFEPSVTRALAMAGIATLASARGSPMSAVRILPMALVGLLLIDPLLARSLAFQLSVAATAGLIVVSPRLEPRLPGPDGMRAAVAATLGAQIAVAPLLLASFGGVSVVAVPANVLAAPAAAFVMMWGLTAGTLAGLSPASVATVLHVPTDLAVGWIELVARRAADIPVGTVGVTHLVVAGGGVAVAFRGRGAIRRLGQAAVVAALVIPLLFSPALPAGHHRLAAGVELVRSSAGHDVVVLDRSGGIEGVLESLRTARVGRIDLLISRRGDRGAGTVVRAVTDRYAVTDVWAPPQHHVPGARVRPASGGRLGPLAIEVGSDGVLAVDEVVPPRD